MDHPLEPAFLRLLRRKTAINYYCFHYHFFLRASAYGFPCIFHLLFYFNVDYFSMWFMFRLPDKKVLSKLVIYQSEERIPRVQSFQVRPFHRQLAPFMTIPWTAVNSWSSQFGLGLQVHGYRAQQWHATWGITVDFFSDVGCDVICTQSFMIFSWVYLIINNWIIHISDIMVRYFILKKPNFTPNKI